MKCGKEKEVQKDAKRDHKSPEKMGVWLQVKKADSGKGDTAAADNSKEKKFLEISLGRESSASEMKDPEMHI